MYWLLLTVTVAAFFAVQRWVARRQRRRNPPLDRVSPRWLVQNVYHDNEALHR